MTAQLSIQLIKIDHYSLWEFRAWMLEVAKLVDMVREVVPERHLHTDEIQSDHKMLWKI
jgi:hypothetical protein